MLEPVRASDMEQDVMLEPVKSSDVEQDVVLGTSASVDRLVLCLQLQ